MCFISLVNILLFLIDFRFSHSKITKDVVPVTYLDDFPDFLSLEYFMTKLVPAVVIEQSIILASNAVMMVVVSVQFHAREPREFVISIV